MASHGKVGRWSARHPWTAITCWIAFVALAIVIGGAVGTKQLTEAESASGESGVAARTLDKAGFKIQPGEQVLVQSDDAARDRPGVPRRRRRRHAAPRRTPNVVKLRSPYAQNTISQGRPLGARLVRDPRHASTRVADKVAPIQATTAAAQSAHPGFLIAEAGDGSFSKAYNDTQGKDFAEGRAALAADHAADPGRSRSAAS